MSSRRSARAAVVSSTGAKEEKKKNLIQLNINSVASTVRSVLSSDKNSEKTATQRTRCSSSDQSGLDQSSVELPDNSCDVTEEIDLSAIYKSLEEIKQGMVSKSDIGEVVRRILSELKSDFVNEIKMAVKDEIKKELKNEIKSEFEKSTQKNIDESLRRVNIDNIERFDALNMDVTDVRETIAREKRELQKLSDELKTAARNARQAISMANYNQQYSQKCNIKILGWREHTKENLREEFCNILKQRIQDLHVNPADILAIHRIPDNRSGGPRPVIVRMISPEAKTNIIRHRQVMMKKDFTMVDHITQQNAKLIQKLKEHPNVHSAWYFNSKVFALDRKDCRHTFDIFDDINKKLS
jgi:hypothetical protein